VVLKLQWVEPDTCEKPGCRYLELWNTDDPPFERTHNIAGFERQCSAHADPDIPLGVMLWDDGNWKGLDAYIAYQREWFRWLDFKNWQIKHPDKEMPPQMRKSDVEPVTSGTVARPAQVKRDALDAAYALNRDHNVRKNIMVKAATLEGAEPDDVSWSWVGAGDSRVLHFAASLTGQQRTSVQAIADIQFGPGLVVVGA